MYPTPLSASLSTADDLRVIVNPPGHNFVISFGRTGLCEPLAKLSFRYEACSPKELATRRK